MAVKLRLKRMGAKKRPFYRIVAADSSSPRDGKFIELVGTYNPITEPAEVKVNEEVALKWLNNDDVEKYELIEIKSRSDLDAMMKIQELLEKNEDYNSDEDSLNGWDYFALDAVEERNNKK